MPGFAEAGALFLAVTVFVAILVYFALVAPVRENPRLCVRRRFAHWLGCVGFVAGSVYWVFVPRGHILVNPITGFMAGAVLGELVGAVTWRYLKVAERERSL